ncbi:MAG TPA: hypothetical protein VFS21_15210, partial [Roseiflexaceae bacterium]|nr:hypothetical protein [Roseiflexaceae bacterium]
MPLSFFRLQSYAGGKQIKLFPCRFSARRAVRAENSLSQVLVVFRSQSCAGGKQIKLFPCRFSAH